MGVNVARISFFLVRSRATRVAAGAVRHETVFKTGGYPYAREGVVFTVVVSMIRNRLGDKLNGS